MSNLNITTSLHKHGIISDAEIEKHIDRALDQEDFIVRRSAIRHPNATSANIDKALDHKEPYVRWSAIQHPNVTSTHIDKALSDGDSYVREEAQRIKKERNL